MYVLALIECRAVFERLVSKLLLCVCARRNVATAYPHTYYND